MSGPKVKVIEADLGDVLKEMGGRQLKAGDGLDDVISALVDEARGLAKPFENIVDAQAEALNYMAQPVPVHGSFVERNEFGEVSYTYPRKGDKHKEVAVVSEVYPTYRLDERGAPYNGIITVVGAKAATRSFPVDLRKYKTVEINKA